LEVLTKSDRGIERAAAIVRGGGVVAFPTDTVYGLGCDPHNVQALRKLCSMKGRREKPIPILVSSPKLAQQIVLMDNKTRALMSRFWPGPLSIVAKSRVRFPNLLTKRRKTIAVRCPRNPIARKLIRHCGGLLTGTSANITGRAPCRSAETVRRVFVGKIDAVVDSGRSPGRTASTVVSVNSRGITMLRKGPIKEAQIRQALQRLARTAREKA
jgi:L-threonylcarbamoyladenylate synthase